MQAATIWTLPGGSYGSAEQAASLEPLADELFAPRAGDVRTLFELFEENLPAGRYYHLEWWATHRDHAGRGLGATLLRANLERIDAERLPCYLESTNPRNIPRYEGFGFRKRGSFAPPNGPTITTMWREPADSSRA